MVRLLDANAILRYVLCDDEQQAGLVRSAVLAGAATLPEVVCECVYVLQGRVYGFARSEVASALLSVLADVDCERMATMREALRLYSALSLDFVDCILAASAKIENADVLTFDKKLRRVIETGSPLS